jgi:hypothetical protein
MPKSYAGIDTGSRIVNMGWEGEEGEGCGTFKVEPRTLLYEVSVALNPTPPKSFSKI